MSKFTTAERFYAKIERSSDGCWNWTAYKMPNGYGVFGVGGRANGSALAHRFAYELLVGPIPDGLELDHLCRNRGCVNPDHLEPVTRLVNVQRGLGHGSETHCPQGHPYDDQNTLHWKGRRFCKACNAANSRRWRERKRCGT